MKAAKKFKLAKMPGVRVLLVVAPYYRAVADHLQRGAEAVAEKADAVLDRVFVPGAFEIPGAIAQAARGESYEGFVALGCVVRGETSHYDYVCGERARGLMDLSTRERLAIGYGILTVDTIEQAVARADPEAGDKGGEAMRACLAMVALQRRFSELAQ